MPGSCGHPARERNELGRAHLWLFGGEVGVEQRERLGWPAGWASEAAVTLVDEGRAEVVHSRRETAVGACETDEGVQTASGTTAWAALGGCCRTPEQLRCHSGAFVTRGQPHGTSVPVERRDGQVRLALPSATFDRTSFASPLNRSAPPAAIAATRGTTPVSVSRIGA